MSSRSLTLSIQEPLNHSKELISRQRSPTTSESWELTEFQAKNSKVKEMGKGKDSDFEIQFLHRNGRYNEKEYVGKKI
jgi:hypothetical protein